MVMMRASSNATVYAVTLLIPSMKATKLEFISTPVAPFLEAACAAMASPSVSTASPINGMSPWGHVSQILQPKLRHQRKTFFIDVDVHGGGKPSALDAYQLG
ncbi:hypothetical protein E4U59_005157 [Claviceps monticola]|nr:hypothetical protein E4U59_005157 [Claviceps monticola]